MLKASNVPMELKKLNNWVLWKDINGNKVPFNAKTLKGAMSNNKRTWTDFITAYSQLINNPDFTGLGFMLSNDIVCIDLDNKDGSLSDQEFQNLLNDCLKNVPSYCEVSVSGKGYHIFAKGKVPDGYRKKKNIEIYDTARFIAFTGNIYGDYTEVIDCQSGIEYIHGKYLGEKQVKSQNIDTQWKKPSSNPPDIEKVLKRAENNEKFMTLYRGDWGSLGYPSQSEADSAFASLLAFYCEKDFETMDAIFRQSGLMRKKYDRNQSGSTYGRITLENAIMWTTDIYEDNFYDGELVNYSAKSSKDRQKRVFNANTDVEPIIDKKDAKNDKIEVEAEFVKNIAPIKAKFTDTANAKSLINEYGSKIRYNFDNKAWYIWNGMYWEWDIKDEIRQYVEELAYKMLDEARKTFDTDAIKNAYRMLNTNGKNSLLNESKHQDGIPIINAECDVDKFLINTHSGIYDLENDRLLKHDISKYMTKITSCEINGNKPKLWLKFLDDIFLKDKDIINYIQKAVGYTLTGSIKEQVIFILFGDGNNGKSVFIDTIQKMINDYATSVPVEVLLEKKGRGNIETTIARIKGMRMIHASENDEDDHINEKLIKQITGGEKVVGRFLYGNEFEYYPEYKLWLSTNNKPKIKGTDFGIWRRIVIIPFKRTLKKDEVDKDLADKLEDELPMILNWAIQGFQKFQKEGLELPQVLIDEKAQYQQEMDYISNFIADVIEARSGYKTPASSVYQEYEKWCKKTNSKIMSSVAFGKEFGKNFERKREASGMVYLDCYIKDQKVDYSIRQFGGKKNAK